MAAPIAAWFRAPSSLPSHARDTIRIWNSRTSSPRSFAASSRSKRAAMDVWHFTEMPYPHLPPFEELSTIRVTLPGKYFDPKIGADLFNRYLDEYLIAD